MSSFLPSSPRRPSLDIFRPIRRKLDGYNVKTPKIAHFLCGIIPAQCPFERQLQIGGRTLVKIP
ncbi:MAG: Mo-dependent nitrogenase C-terminal domain-containing protein, partial [Cyanobacteria bacterium P01_H01_bin.15]